MKLDLKTVFIIYTLILTTCLIFVSFMHFTHKRYKGAWLWFFAVVTQTFALYLFLLRGMIPDFISISIANMLLLFCPILISHSYWRLRFNSRFPSLFYILTLIFALIVPLYQTKNVLFRIKAFAVLIIPLILVSVAVLVTGHKKKNRISFYFVGIIHTLMAAIFVFHIIATYKSKYFTEFFGIDNLLSVLYITHILIFILLILGYYMIVSHLTEEELKLNEQRVISQKNLLKNKNKKLQKLMNVKSDFLAIASHDLRTPFASIIGFSEILLKKK